jgi:hypothetical protein
MHYNLKIDNMKRVYSSKSHVYLLSNIFVCLLSAMHHVSGLMHWLVPCLLTMVGIGLSSRKFITLQSSVVKIDRT